MINVIRTSLLILIFFFPHGLSFAQSPQALFDEANEQLEKRNYTAALATYQQIENGNKVSGALFLNMGITYQRLDSLGKAKYYFLKASQFEETSKIADQALEYINNQFSRQSAILPQLPWDVAVRWLQQNIGAKSLILWGIIFLNAGALIFILPWFVGSFSKYLRQISYLVAGSAILIILSGFYTQYVSDRYSTAVMINQKAPVLEQPQTEASLVSQSFEGYTFTVDHYSSRSEPGWAYVRMSNGLYGWIPTSEILIL